MKGRTGIYKKLTVSMDDGAIKAEIIVEGKCLEIGEGYFKLVHIYLVQVG